MQLSCSEVILEKMPILFVPKTVERFLNYWYVISRCYSDIGNQEKNLLPASQHFFLWCTVTGKKFKNLNSVEQQQLKYLQSMQGFTKNDCQESPSDVQEAVFLTPESTEVAAFQPLHGKCDIEYAVTGLCWNSRNPSLLGHTAYDFGEEIHSSVIKYYFALGKTNKQASSAAYFAIVLRTVLGVSGD